MPGEKRESTKASPAVELVEKISNTARRVEQSSSTARQVEQISNTARQVEQSSITARQVEHSSYMARRVEQSTLLTRMAAVAASSSINSVNSHPSLPFPSNSGPESFEEILLRKRDWQPASVVECDSFDTRVSHSFKKEVQFSHNSNMRIGGVCLAILAFTIFVYIAFSFRRRRRRYVACCRQIYHGAHDNVYTATVESKIDRFTGPIEPGEAELAKAAECSESSESSESPSRNGVVAKVPPRRGSTATVDSENEVVETKFDKDA
jgi:hypothetical protein